MYSDWGSLRNELEAAAVCENVLFHFPSNVGKDVVSNIIKSLMLLSNNSETLIGRSHKSIDWIMEVICYGLSLPLVDIDILRNCSQLYGLWLMNIHNIDDTSSDSFILPVHASMNSANFSSSSGLAIWIPHIILQDPVKYTCTIIEHLNNLFLERSNHQNVIIQCKLCERILYILRKLSLKGKLLPELWNSILKFHLGIVSRLLIPIKYQINSNLGQTFSEQICGSSINNLFCIWVLACKDNYFPEPSMWATLVDICISCRHRSLVVQHWSLIITILTRNVVDAFIDTNISTSIVSNSSTIFSGQSNFILEKEALIQVWYRFIHVLGNISELTNINKTLEFSGMSVIESTKGVSVRSANANDQLDSLLTTNLSENLLKSMRAVSQITSLLLTDVADTSIFVEQWVIEKSNHSKSNQINSSTNLPPHVFSTSNAPNAQSKMKNFSSVKVPSSVRETPQSFSHAENTNNFEKYIPVKVHKVLTNNIFEAECVVKPKLTIKSIIENKTNFTEANTILRLFSKWLFGVFDCILKSPECLNKLSIVMNTFYSSNPKSHQKIMTEVNISDEFEPGRAISIGILCRIFSHKRTSTRVSMKYLSMFYPLICYGLLAIESKATFITLSIISNCRFIFINNLNGLSATIPYFLCAFENIISSENFNFTGFDFIKNNQSILSELHNSIYLIISNLICYPLHFLNKKIPYIFPPIDHVTNKPEFFHIRNRLVALLLKGLDNEVEGSILQLILSSILMSIYDSKTILDSIDRESNVYKELLIDESSFIERLFSEACTKITTKLDSIALNKTVDFSTTLSLLESIVNIVLVDKTLNQLELVHKLFMDICKYISTMALKPSYMHTKDLHSVIVALFHCLAIWIGENPSVLNNKECLQSVVTVIELGLTGIKSKSEDPSTYMARKELKPVSLRVKEAAEYLLSIINDNLLFNLKHDLHLSFKVVHSETSICKMFGLDLNKFVFYSLDDCSLLSILDHSNDSVISCIILVRTSSGRHAFKMTYNHYSNSQEKSHLDNFKKYCANVKPIFINKSYSHKHLDSIESISQLPKCKLDEYPPSNQKIIQDLNKALFDRQNISLRNQIIEENNTFGEYKTYVQKESSEHPIKSSPPNSHTIEDACRLFLMDLNFFTGNFSKATLLDHTSPTFLEDLSAVDTLPIKYYERAFVFICRNYQSDAEQIFNNKIDMKTDQVLLEFLEALGTTLENKTSSSRVIFYSDITTEVDIFLAPFIEESLDRNASKNMNSNESRSSFSETKNQSGFENRVIITWIQNISCIHNFPYSKLLELSTGDTYSSTDSTHNINPNKCHLLIFIEPLNNGLYHIHTMLTNGSTYNMYPLPCGSVISRRLLPIMVKQLSLSFFLKKRFNAETYLQPHQTRKLAIQKFCRKYKSSKDPYVSMLKSIGKKSFDSTASILSNLSFTQSDDNILSVSNRK